MNGVRALVPLKDKATIHNFFGGSSDLSEHPIGLNPTRFLLRKEFNEIQKEIPTILNIYLG